MCGIALLVSGIRLDFSSLHLQTISPDSENEQLVFSVDDIKLALQRRGPDSLCSQKIYLNPKISTSAAEQEQDLVSSFLEGVESSEREDSYLHHNSLFSANGATHKKQNDLPVTEMHFLGATLQLRGVNPITQPFVDSCKNVLVYNGEIFGGIVISSDCNDAEVLMESLGNCCCKFHESSVCNCNAKGKSSVPDVLSTIKGPWAVIYWQDSTKTLWFGRDAFGRRSLLVHWPTLEDSRFLLSSVSPTSSTLKSSDTENGIKSANFWEELPCGIYSLSVSTLTSDASLVGVVRRHEWRNTVLKDLIEWDRTSVEPTCEDLKLSCSENLSGKSDTDEGSSGCTRTVLTALKESVMQRTSLYRIFQAEKELVPVAVLFSGGLDSMILAALLDQCVDPIYAIDLLNVSFDGQSAPDRISARAGIEELRRIAPFRSWKLVEIDADLSKLTLETKHVLSLINPANTYMDLNIALALWLAAGGDGWVHEDIAQEISKDSLRIKYKSTARILLVGAGADEQCAGYGRHRTKFRNKSWLGLHEEMKLDMQRIWKRNLGRDDRCIADNGKEARFPFLDEDVIKTLLAIPLWEIANLEQPSGKGDKKILREVAQLLGLREVTTLPKRAIQFGSRIARESNRKNFGSNRAANQASAGSVVIRAPPSERP